MSTNTTELKKLLHESIENIDDEAFLQAVKEILDRKYQPEEISLSSHREKRIEEAKRSIDKGNVLTNEEADQLVTKWLNE
jgi:hypothetical protein